MAWEYTKVKIGWEESIESQAGRPAFRSICIRRGSTLASEDSTCIRCYGSRYWTEWRTRSENSQGV